MSKMFHYIVTYVVILVSSSALGTENVTRSRYWDEEASDKGFNSGAEEIEEKNENASPHQSRYYQYRFAESVAEAKDYWVDMDSVQADPHLSSSNRKALTHRLSFDFAFFGQLVRNNVTIASGGFIGTGSTLHRWLAATQYVAPFMAGFDPSLSDNSTVKWVDAGSSLTVQWEDFVLSNSPSIGTFTFQVTVNEDGRIVFVYKSIAIPLLQIDNETHPVKVGLSDAYVLSKIVYNVNRKVIYEYNKIDLTNEDSRIKNWSAILLEPLPSCPTYHTCHDCRLADKSLRCKWCPSISHCSDGTDRRRQDWSQSNCTINFVSVDTADCFETLFTATTPEVTTAPVTPEIIPENATETPWINPFEWSYGVQDTHGSVTKSIKRCISHRNDTSNSITYKMWRAYCVLSFFL